MLTTSEATSRVEFRAELMRSTEKTILTSQANTDTMCKGSSSHIIIHDCICIVTTIQIQYKPTYWRDEGGVGGVRVPVFALRPGARVEL